MANQAIPGFWKSLFGMKCPRCREGDLFETGSFSFEKPFDMPKRCPKCNQNYMPEPGFYYGAMFISYIISGWFCILFVMFFHWVLDWGYGATFGLLILISAIFFVWFFRFSRTLWIYLNVKYKGVTNYEIQITNVEEGNDSGKKSNS